MLGFSVLFHRLPAGARMAGIPALRDAAALAAASYSTLLSDQHSGSSNDMESKVHAARDHCQRTVIIARNACASDPREFRKDFVALAAFVDGLSAVVGGRCLSGSQQALVSPPENCFDISEHEEISCLAVCVQALCNCIAGPELTADAELTAIRSHLSTKYLNIDERQFSLLSLLLRRYLKEIPQLISSKPLLLRAQTACVAFAHTLLVHSDPSQRQRWLVDHPWVLSSIACWTLETDESTPGHGREWGAVFVNSILQCVNTGSSALGQTIQLSLCRTPANLMELVPLLRFLDSLLEESSLNNSAEAIVSTLSKCAGPLAALASALFDMQPQDDLESLRSAVGLFLNIFGDACESQFEFIERQGLVVSLVEHGFLARVLHVVNELNKCDSFIDSAVAAQHNRSECSHCQLWGDMENAKQKLLRIIANMCYRCKLAQDALRVENFGGMKHGVHVILDSSRAKIDDEKLRFVREWAILALRNACEGNMENQAAVESLQQQSVVQDEELVGAGLEVVHDEENNSFRLRRSTAHHTT